MHQPCWVTLVIQERGITGSKGYVLTRLQFKVWRTFLSYHFRGMTSATTSQWSFCQHSQDHTLCNAYKSSRQWSLFWFSILICLIEHHNRTQGNHAATMPLMGFEWKCDHVGRDYTSLNLYVKSNHPYKFCNVKHEYFLQCDIGQIMDPKRESDPFHLSSAH